MNRNVHVFTNLLMAKLKLNDVSTPFFYIILVLLGLTVYYMPVQGVLDLGGIIAIPALEGLVFGMSSEVII